MSGTWEEPPSVAESDFTEYENSFVRWKTGLSSQMSFPPVQLKSDPKIVIVAEAQHLDWYNDRFHWTAEMHKRNKARYFNTAITLTKFRIGENGALSPIQTKTHTCQVRLFTLEWKLARFFESSD